MDRHAAYVALSRPRDGVDLHYGRDDFADRDRLARTLSRERAKDMASDYVAEFAERRGWDGPEKGVAEPDRVQNEERRAARAVFERHARAVAALFQAQESGMTLAELDRKGLLGDKTEELRQARRGLDAYDPNYSRDVERAYRADPELGHEAAGGNIRRAVQAMRLEGELRRDAPARAERFIERWTSLDAQRQAAYRAGDISGERHIRNSIGSMAEGLERDPQVESILAGKKAQLGIGGLEIGGRLTRQLAISIGFDLGRGLGIGL
jgi:hypothetical protein